MKRYLLDQVIKDLNKKMVFIGGPRQVGKTTLAQSLAPKSAYLNWDDAEDREKILRNQLPAQKVLIFDELHKYRSWRNYLKGLYDKNKNDLKILVTGSARLDFYRFGGDSLQGRYHYLRLHPITMDELHSFKAKTVEDLMQLGGFPEPFLSGNKIEAKRWSREYRQRILKDDITSIELIEDLTKAEQLLLRLPDLVGSPLSMNSLREDLQVDFKTIKRWIEIFERFYALFKIAPFGSPKIKAVKKEQKHYHFDWTLVKNEGSKFENFVASHLLKWVHYFEDTEGRDLQLCFYKDREQREVDFVITENSKPICFIECKLAEKSLSPNLIYLSKKFPSVPCYQLTLKDVGDFQTKEGQRLAPVWKGLEEIKALFDVKS